MRTNALKKYVHKEVTRHGKTIYYFRKAQCRYRLPDEYGSKEFWAEYDKALSGNPPPHVRETVSRKTKKRLEGIHDCLKRGVLRAKTSAKAKGLPFDITLDWAIETAAASNYRCPLTHIPFSSVNDGTGYARPFAPSLDRRNPKGGYTKDNVRIVTYAVNMMISDWGEEIFARAAHGFRYVQYKTRTRYSLTNRKDARTLSQVSDNKQLISGS